MSWSNVNEVTKNTGMSPGNSSDWLRFEDGSNNIRLASGIEADGSNIIGKHYTGQKYAICVGLDHGCAWCQQENRPSPRCIVWVFDRGDGNKLKLAELPYEVYSQIGEYAGSDKWGVDESGIPNYDFDVKKGKDGGRVKYTVLPDPNKSPLLDEERAQVEEETPAHEVAQALKDKERKRLEGGAPEDPGRDDEGFEQHVNDQLANE